MLLKEVLEAPKELQLDDSDFNQDSSNDLTTIRSFVDSSQKYAKHALGEGAVPESVSNQDIDSLLKQKRIAILKRKQEEQDLKAKIDQELLVR